MLHRETVPQHTLELLEKLTEPLQQLGFYLAGETALSLRLGHRISVDLDFFKAGEFVVEEIIELARSMTKEVRIVNQSKYSLALEADQTKLEFLRYDNEQLEELERVEGVCLCSFIDNALMKLSALVGRGAKKDFADIAKIIATIPLSDLLEKFSLKYPETDPFVVVKSLTYFEDAELEPDPIFIDDNDWSQVKAQILNATREL